MKQEITQEYVKELFEYKDGFLYWKISNSNRVKIGSKAGSLHHTGYYQIKIDSKLYLNHRLIFLYYNGYLPKYLDHIDGNRSNNKIENLREVTKSQNSQNMKPHKNKSSIYKGVSWNKNANKWIVRISGIYLGLFINESNAAIIYNKKAIELFGEYAYLNIIKENNK